MNKCVSKTKVPLLALAGAALLGFAFGGLYADEIPPDPADCFFYVIPNTVEEGFSGTGYVLAVSADGKAALGGVAVGGGVNFINDEYIFHDGKRTLLTHNDYNSPPSGKVLEWFAVDLNFDGSSVLAQKRVGGVDQGVILSFPSLVETPIAMPNPLKLSDNGRWVVGKDANFHLSRIRLADGFTDQPPPDLQGTNYSVTDVFGVSSTGTVYGVLLAGEWPQSKKCPFQWTSDGGFSCPPVPAKFTVASMDEAGETLAGFLSDAPNPPGKPAYWTQQGGLVNLTTVLSGVDARQGYITGISGDGQLIFGALSQGAFSQVAVVWTRTGSVYLLSELIRGVDLGGASPYAPALISRDGRTIAGSIVDGGTPRGLYLAGLALPGEGPRLVLNSLTGGGRSLSFHTKSAFHYQVQSSTNLNAWDSVGTEIAGDDTEHAVSLPEATFSAGFFRVVVGP